MDYKKYSLENLENWLHDAISCSEATPQEIYDVIKNVVGEEYYIYKNHTERCYELLALLNGNGNSFNIDPAGNYVGNLDGVYLNQSPIFCDKDDKSAECKKAWNDFWEENYYPEEHQKHSEEVKDDCMPPWGHSDLEYLIANPTLTEDRISNFPGEQYTEEELNAMCDKAASDEEKNKCREYNLREAEYYDKRSELDSKSNNAVMVDGYSHSKYYYEYDRNDQSRSNPFNDKVVKWQLPVEVDGISGEYYIQFPDDLLEAANIKEDDLVQWIDRGDGSYLLKKVDVHS